MAVAMAFHLFVARRSSPAERMIQLNRRLALSCDWEVVATFCRPVAVNGTFRISTGWLNLQHDFKQASSGIAKRQGWNSGQVRTPRFDAKLKRSLLMLLIELQISEMCSGSLGARPESAIVYQRLKGPGGPAQNCGELMLRWAAPCCTVAGRPDIGLQQQLACPSQCLRSFFQSRRSLKSVETSSVVHNYAAGFRLGPREDKSRAAPVFVC